MQLADETPEWRSLAELSAELRRLNDLVATRAIDDARRGELARAVAAWAGSVESAPERDKQADMQTRPHLDLVYRDQPAPLDVGDGEALEFDPFSVIGGSLHPASMDVRFSWEGGEAVGRVTVTDSHSGPPERVHGGVVAAIVDEVMGVCNRVLGRRAFTASLSVDFRAAAPVGVELEFRARTVAEDGRKITIACTGTTPEGVFAEATGLFVRPRPEI